MFASKSMDKVASILACASNVNATIAITDTDAIHSGIDAIIAFLNVGDKIYLYEKYGQK